MLRAWRTSSYKENNGSPLSRVSSTHTCKQYSSGGEHTCNDEASEQTVPPRLAMLRAWRASGYIENNGSPAKTSPEANITSEHGINKGMRREFQQKESFVISKSHSYQETVSPPKTSAEENIASEHEINRGESLKEESRFITKTLSFREGVSGGPPNTLFNAGENIASEHEINEGKSPKDSFYISRTSPCEQDVLMDEKQNDQDALRKRL